MRSYIFQIDPAQNMQDIHGIIGPGCSSAAEPVAELAQFFNLIVVSISIALTLRMTLAWFPFCFYYIIVAICLYIPHLAMRGNSISYIAF